MIVVTCIHRDEYEIRKYASADDLIDALQIDYGLSKADVESYTWRRGWNGFEVESKEGRCCIFIYNRDGMWHRLDIKDLAQPENLGGVLEEFVGSVTHVRG